MRLGLDSDFKSGLQISNDAVIKELQTVRHQKPNHGRRELTRGQSRCTVTHRDVWISVQFQKLFMHFS